MIIRTPPQRKRRAESDLDHDAAVAAADGRLVIYENPVPVTAVEPSDEMVCTYQCRQMVKSEFIGALNSAEKQLHDYQSTLAKLNDELHKTEEERKKYQDRLNFIEQELAASKGREHALQERLLKEVDDNQERYRNQLQHCNELEVRLKKEIESRKNAESSVASAKDRATDFEEKLRRLSESLEREKNNSMKEISFLQDESKLSVSRINADLEKVRMRADNSEKESEILKTQLEDLKQQLNECLHQKSELEHKLSRLTAPVHESNNSEVENLVKHLQEELRNYEAEVLEARRLKSSYQNNEMLREKLTEEKVHREKAETELSKLQEVQLNATKLEHELTSWKSLLNDIPDVSCFDDIPKKFAELQKETIENMMKVGEINARCKELEVALELAVLSKQHAEKESALAKERADNSALEVKRLELLLKSVTEERERQIKGAIMWNKQNNELVDNGLANETLVKDLESSLFERDRTIRDLESSLLEQREVMNHRCDELKIMNEKLSIEARRVKSLEREGDRLRAEISLLESKLGHGDFSAANTKVLRMVNTLAVDDETKHTIEALQAELRKTQAKLQAVEELNGQSVAGNLIDADISEKLAHLKSQIAILEKRETRYRAVFAERIAVFRKACCSLFGYKILMDDQQRPNGIPVTRFTLQSIYAQSEDENLEFEYESGSTNILVNDYTSQPEISHQIQIFIKNMNSIPAFTANLTIESFNKRTLS